jgi:hypothetical protein
MSKSPSYGTSYYHKRNTGDGVMAI